MTSSFILDLFNHLALMKTKFIW